MNKKNILNSKLSKYSIATSAALIALAGCKDDDGPIDNPNVEYNDISDITISAPDNNSNFIQIDVNSDGMDDFELGAYNYVGSDYNYSFVELFTLGDNETLVDIVTFTTGTDTDDEEEVKPLNAGDDISVSSSIWDDSSPYVGKTGIYDGNSIEGSIFAGKEAYVGIRFDILGVYHYGWMRVEISDDARTFTLKDMAYNVVPGEGLKAGEI